MNRMNIYGQVTTNGNNNNNNNRNRNKRKDMIGRNGSMWSRHNHQGQQITYQKSIERMKERQERQVTTTTTTTTTTPSNPLTCSCHGFCTFLRTPISFHFLTLERQ